MTLAVGATSLLIAALLRATVKRKPDAVEPSTRRHDYFGDRGALLR